MSGRYILKFTLWSLDKIYVKSTFSFVDDINQLHATTIFREHNFDFTENLSGKKILEFLQRNSCSTIFELPYLSCKLISRNFSEVVRSSKSYNMNVTSNFWRKSSHVAVAEWLERRTLDQLVQIEGGLLRVRGSKFFFSFFEVNWCLEPSSGQNKRYKYICVYKHSNIWLKTTFFYFPESQYYWEGFKM